MRETDWGKYFEMLIDWKKLPAYRFEPRLDSIIGYYLPEIVRDHVKDIYKDINKDINIKGIIPEFPIRKGTILENIFNEEALRVDFLLISENGPNYLVEIKTDSKSRNDKQDGYLELAKEKKLKALINGIKSIYSKTKSKDKYEHLIDKLEGLKLIKKIDKKYDNFEFIGENKDIKILYVQPSQNGKDDIIDFKQISKWLEKNKQGDGIFEENLSKLFLKLYNDEVKAS